jgi:hypothetical protein
VRYSFFVFRVLFFSSRKAAKPQRDFSLHLFAFVRYPFISLRLCAFARHIFFLSLVRYFFLILRVLFFSSCKAAKPPRDFSLHPAYRRQASRFLAATLHFFASLRLCAITPFLKNSLKGYLQSELFHF